MHAYQFALWTLLLSRLRYIQNMNGTDDRETAIHDADDLGGYTSQRHVAASHTSDDGHRPMEPVHTPTGASRTRAPVHQPQITESSALFGTGHYLASLTAHNYSIAEVGPR
jgi:hypothetical protein